ncbi:hypothetical protein RRG08_038719 [Elysia crispata]|uniref:Uncharacterized protein n=1 Tax=Elysia crispata TaxID=231223 RepID=A0AAE0ZIZ6_9GAST|nr:hypothetical protein RRG08_038719 [Elysia crispata]
MTRFRPTEPDSGHWTVDITDHSGPLVRILLHVHSLHLAVGCVSSRLDTGLPFAGPLDFFLPRLNGKLALLSLPPSTLHSPNQAKIVHQSVKQSIEVSATRRIQTDGRDNKVTENWLTDESVC